MQGLTEELDTVLRRSIRKAHTAQMKDLLSSDRFNNLRLSLEESHTPSTRVRGKSRNSLITTSTDLNRSIPDVRAIKKLKIGPAYRPHFPIVLSLFE